MTISYHQPDVRKRDGITLPRWAAIDSLIQKRAANVSQSGLGVGLPAAGAPRFWSTSEPAGLDPITYYGEGICEAFMAMSPRIDPGYRFHAAVSSRQFAHLRINRVFATGHKIVRNQFDIARSLNACFYLNMQVSGRGRYQQRGREQVISAGCVTLIDSADAFQMEHDLGKPYDVVSVVVPKDLLGDDLHHAEECVNQTLNKKTPVGVVLSHHLMTIVEHLPNFSGSESAGLLDGLTELLRQTCRSAANASKPDGGAGSPTRTLIDIQCYMTGKLCDPSLSVEDVACEFGVSKRYVYALFARAGLTFKGWLTDERLTHAWGRLRTLPSQAHSIAAIAFECGFNDLSHFNRSFKERFGCTPRQLRS